MSDAPQVLLQQHLKKLKLPTFQSEHAKLARQCAAGDRAAGARVARVSDGGRGSCAMRYPVEVLNPARAAATGTGPVVRCFMDR